jgi:hydrogenase expression/formation protein HypC
MCLGELAEVVGLDGERAEVATSGGRRTTVSLMVLAEPVAVGDWVVVHAGFALERVSPAEAQEAERIRSAGDDEEEESP